MCALKCVYIVCALDRCVCVFMYVCVPIFVFVLSPGQAGDYEAGIQICSTAALLQGLKL